MKNPGDLFDVPGHTILIVDDDPANLSVVVDYLATHGFQIMVARDGEAGLRLATQDHPDLILLDVLLPGIDGFETCRRLKADAQTRDIPVIFMTIVTRMEDKVRGFEKGGVDYITKPFQHEEVLARVTTHLRIRDLTREIEAANENLERRVAERTAELSQANVRLEEEITERNQAEETVRQSEELLRVTLTNILDPVFITDNDGEFTFICPNVLNTLGYSVEEVQALGNISRIVGEGLFNSEALELRGEFINIERLIVDHSGRQRVFLVTVRQVSIGQGTRLFTLHDITERKHAEEALTHERNLLRTLIDHIPDFIYIKDVESRFLIANPSVAHHMGAASPTELVGRTDWDFYPPERVAPFYADERAIMQSGNPLLDHDEPNVDASGNLRWIMTTKLPMRDSHGQIIGLVGIGHDLTERKHAEEALHRLNRELRAISNCNQTLLRAVDEQTLLNDICRIVCDEAGYHMAWVGYAGNDDAKTIRPVAWAGNEAGYLEPLRLTWADTERGRGPAGTAIRRGESVCIQDFATDAQTAPWRENALQRGYRSNIALPLKDENAQTFGALIIYSTEPNAFTPEEIRLLEELAGDLAFGVSTLRSRAERKRAEEALRDSEERYRYLIENLSEVIFALDTQGNLNYLSPAIRGISGYTPEETIGQHFSHFVHPDDLPKLQASLGRVLAGQRESTQFRIITRDGSIRWVQSSSRQHYRHNQLVGVMGVLIDTTDRKQAEDRILSLNRLYATLSQINQTIVHVRDRAQLFEQICRVTVDHGQFRLAWIGLIDETTHQVKPVAFAGEELGYLATVNITYLDETLGRGPTGTAIREGRCIICQDIATDPRMAPWRDQALQRGYRSSAAVPIRQHTRVIGALIVYLAQPQGLDAEDEQLLDEIGLDISFALDGLEQEAQRRRADAELGRLNAELEQRVIDRTAELERAHERLRAILDTAGEGVVFTDPQGTIEYINPALERLTGYTADEVLGRNPRLWKSAHTPLSTYQHMWRALLRGEIWQGELINRRRDGALYDAALTTSPVTDLDGRIVGYVGVQRDITRQKELDRLKDQFVSNVSHELRTPIANIMLHLGLLIRGRPERHDIYLRTLQREADRLRRMIEDLLDLSRLDRNVTPIQLTPTDIHQLLESLVVDRAALAAQRGLTLTYEPAPGLPLALSDASKLMQVISNLLTNALNYTPAGGQVTVLSAVHRTTTQQWIAIIVRDTGPGIADNDQAHLFERFYRGEAGRNADAPGTGLGLAISHEIMERLGGRITVESEPGQGAAFTVWVKADNDGVTR